MLYRRYNFIEVIMVVFIISIILGLFTRYFFGNESEIRNEAAIRALEKGIERMQWLSSADHGNTLLCPVSNQGQCGKDWSKGWMIFSDIDQNKILNGQERIEHIETKQLPQVLSANIKQLVIDKSGNLKANAIFYFCTGQHLMSLELNRTANAHVRTIDDRPGAC